MYLLTTSSDFTARVYALGFDLQPIQVKYQIPNSPRTRFESLRRLDKPAVTRMPRHATR